MTNKTQPLINIKGFLVGNGVTNWKYDTNPSLPDTLGGFDMIPRSLLDEFNNANCVIDRNGEAVSGPEE